jgi:hypothetical protein
VMYQNKSCCNKNKAKFDIFKFPTNQSSVEPVGFVLPPMTTIVRPTCGDI